MSGLTPWALARRAGSGRRTMLVLLVAALLFGFGLHAARACMPAGHAAHAHGAAGHPCQNDVDLTQGACATHCQSDAQGARLSPVFELPAAAPPNLRASLDPLAPSAPLVPAPAAPLRDTGPPLHIVLHRLLR